jgi:hypothetical protein
MIRGLSENRVEEIHHSECTSHQREDPLPSKIHLCSRPGVCEDIVEPDLSQCELSVVRVSAEILECMQSLAETSHCLAEILLIP